MTKTILLLLGLAFFCQISRAQNLDCNDFKAGSFILPKSDLVPFSFRVTRIEREQIEQAFDIPDSLVSLVKTDKHFGNIRWTGKCSYTLLYDSAKMILDPIMKQINMGGGLVVEMNSIEKNCANYTAVGTINGEKTTMKGRICKVKD